MDEISDQGLGCANSDQNFESNDNIDLGNPPQWNEPTDWELEQLEEQERRGNNLHVQHWLHDQPNSQPSQNTFITSQSLPQRQLDNYKVIDHVDDVLRRSRRSSAQTIGTPNTTVPRTRHITTSSNVTSIDQRLMQNARPLAPSFLPFGTTSERQIRYTDNGNHDEGRPPGLSTHQEGLSAFTNASGLHTRGVYRQSIGPIPQQTAWSATGTDKSSGSKKVPKRQNSRSTDDEAAGKQQLAKRYRSGQKVQSIHRPSPAPAGSSRLAKPGSGAPLQTIEDTRVSPRRVRNIPPLSVSGDPSSSNIQRDGSVRARPCDLVTPEDFKNACETCFFWLFDPKRLSSPERHACSGRKDEISHIITHATDHHGLIRGRDPNYSARKYLTSCHKFDPFNKAKGNCDKCSLLHEWQGRDFADHEHHGVALCLRCWRQFEKKGMQDHMTEPLCDYNAEQPKEKKVCILYTTFCSVTQKPSGPPKNMPPRKSNYRNTANKYKNSKHQNNNNQSPRRPVLEQPTRDLRPASSKTPHGQGKTKAFPTSTVSPVTHDRSRLEMSNPVSQQTMRKPTSLPTASTYPFSWQQPNTHQSGQPPIALMPIYANTSPEHVASMVKNMQRNGTQEGTQSPYSPIDQATSFGSLESESSSYSFQPQQAQAQGILLPSYQYSNLQPSFQQRSPQTFSQGSYRNADFTRLFQPASAQNELSQQSFHPFLMHKIATDERQGPRIQVPTSINSPMYNGGDDMVYQACLDATTNSNLFQGPAMPAVDRDAAVSLSDIISQVQSSASRVPSTAGESMGLLQRSPKVEENRWLDQAAFDDTNDLSNFDFIGSNPKLQVTVEMVEPPSRQPEEKLPDLKPNSRLSPLHHNALENDSGYHTQLGVFDEPEMDLNNMFK
ncbi:hypothetical protein FBEOM_12623 [Fusarium beomiforme]|uniref:Uncharacterized protein n=1 Tax=Fusarium beomiforme TaxID=44412 RepID=A0A9P5A7A5_9HYPO|nr:hypothetical protein FBEOM_12623 [Fusarium beomiforme]